MSGGSLGYLGYLGMSVVKARRRPTIVLLSSTRKQAEKKRRDNNDDGGVAVVARREGLAKRSRPLVGSTSIWTSASPSQRTSCRTGWDI